VQRGVALRVRSVEVQAGQVLQQLQHLDHAVAAQVAGRSLERGGMVLNSNNYNSSRKN
jgi:hypothetical protein